MSAKWESFSESEIKDIILNSKTFTEIGKKLGYAKFSREKMLPILKKYPNLEVNINSIGKREDLSGKRFGELTVISYDKEYSEMKNNMCRYWKCQCDCGNITYVKTAYLKNGCTSSCGCKQKRIAASQTFIDLTGQEFGNLYVVKQGERPEDAKNTRAYWWCQCNCGNPNLILVNGQLLRNGHKTSCGCVQSQYERKTQKILIENDIEYVQQYTFDDLVGDTGTLLRFDFAIFKNHKLVYVIELQGQQHYISIPSWGGEEKFQQRLRYDKKKIKYCKDNNIPLVILSYKDEINQESLGLLKYLKGEE